MHRCSLADTLTHFKCVIAPAFHKYAHYKLTSWHGVCAFVLRPSCFHIFCYKLSAFLCLNPFLISSLFFQRVLVSPPNENMRVKKERKKYRTKLARLFCSCHKFDSRCSRLQPHSNPTSGIIHFDALLGAERSLGLDNTSLKHNLSPTGLVLIFIRELSVQQANQKLLTTTGECNLTCRGAREKWCLMKKKRRAS